MFQPGFFWGFNYTPGANAPAANCVTANLILQTGTVDIHGWNFGSIWSQNLASGALANIVLGYSIEICPLGSPCAGAVVPGLDIFAADAVCAPSAVAPPGPETVTWSNGASVTLTAGSPGPLPPDGNIGLGAGLGQGVPISVTADFSGTGAITQTTFRFYEQVSARTVPEPMSLLLFLGGPA